jgi:hypothetical protein
LGDAIHSFVFRLFGAAFLQRYTPIHRTRASEQIQVATIESLVFKQIVTAKPNYDMSLITKIRCAH